jgi:hypothetical protein
MNVNPRFMSSNEIMEFLDGGDDNTLEELNLRLGLPRQEDGELVYNSHCRFLLRLQNIVLPNEERLEHERSTEMLVNSGNLDSYSGWIELPTGIPYDFDDNAERYTLQLKTIEPLNTQPLNPNSVRYWCYVERTIFFHLDDPYASLDMVMMATSPPASIVGDQAEGPPDGLTFAGTNRTITYEKEPEEDLCESIFREHNTFFDD